MSDAIKRFRARKEERLAVPISDIVEGSLSDDLSKYLPLASGALTEVVTSEVKKSEEAKKQAAAKNSEAGKAQAAAQEARKRAAMAAADALTEGDPSGPKHRTAAQADLDARAAEQKAAFFANQAGGNGSGGSAGSFGVPSGGYHGGGESFFSKYKWPLIGVGAVGALGLVIALVRKK